MGIGAALAVSGLVISVTRDGAGDSEAPVTTAGEGTRIAVEEARAEIGPGLTALLAEPAVEIVGVAYVEGARFDLEATVDLPGRAMQVRERMSPEVEPGDPASADPIVTDQVLVGGTMRARITHPGETEAPYQELDMAGQEEALLKGAYTQLGRLFDSLEVLAAVAQNVDFAAERLAERDLDGSRVTGVRASFDSQAIATWLADSGTEAVGPGAGDGGTTQLELWFSDGALRQIVATGTMFHDGEALEDVLVRLDYRPAPPGLISNP